MMRSFKYIILIAIVALTAGCGRKGSVPLEPSEVVEEFVKAVASGRTDDALKLCDNTRMAGYIETYMEALSRKAETDSTAASIATGLLSEIEITVTEVSKAKGSRTVFYTMKDVYGDCKNKVAIVIEEEGEWKVQEIKDRN